LEGSKEGKSDFVCAGESVNATLLPVIKSAVVVLGIGLDVIIGSLVMEEGIRSKAAKDLIQAQWDTEVASSFHQVKAQGSCVLNGTTQDKTHCQI
jgi:hypothetical protein